MSSRPRPAFLEALQRAERIARLIHRLEAYSHLWFSEDTGNQHALAFKAKVEQFGADISNRMLFFRSVVAGCRGIESKAFAEGCQPASVSFGEH